MSIKDRFNRNKDIKNNQREVKYVKLQVYKWMDSTVVVLESFYKSEVLFNLYNNSFIESVLSLSWHGRFARSKQKKPLDFQVQLLCCHAFSIRCPTSLDWIRTDSLYNLSWLWLDKCFDWIQKTMRYNLSEVHAIKKGLLVWRSRKEKYIFDVCKCTLQRLFAP